MSSKEDRKFSFRRWSYIVVVYGALIALITYLGTYDTQPNFMVDVEYITGILAASSILFGFWFALLGRKPEGVIQTIIFREYLRYIVLYCFVWLASSVAVVFLAALNKLPSVVALWMSLVAFFNTLFAVIFNLWEVTLRY